MPGNFDSGGNVVMVVGNADNDVGLPDVKGINGTGAADILPYV